MNSIQLKVSSKSLDHHTISWTITGDNARPYTIRVLRCESRFGPFEPVSDFFPQTATEYTDTTPVLKLKRAFYYRIEIKSDLGVIETFPKHFGVSDERRDDKEANLLAGESELLYKLSGQAVIYLPIRTYGRRCTKCYDPVNGKRIPGNCSTCYNTTYAGGYLAPVKINIMLEDSQTKEPGNNPSTGVPASSRTAHARFPWFVDLKENDVVIDDNNIRWHICEPIKDVTKRRCRVYQTCVLTQLSYDRVEYTIPVPDEIDTVNHGWKYTLESANTPTGARQYSVDSASYSATQQFSLFRVVCGGPSSDMPLQQVLGLGAAGQLLTSNGATSLPYWADIPDLSVLSAGTGLTGAGYNGTSDVTFSLNFAGTGIANTVARSDHNHDTTYMPIPVAAVIDRIAIFDSNKYVIASSHTLDDLVVDDGSWDP